MLFHFFIHYEEVLSITTSKLQQFNMHGQQIGTFARTDCDHIGLVVTTPVTITDIGRLINHAVTSRAAIAVEKLLRRCCRRISRIILASVVNTSNRRRPRLLFNTTILQTHVHILGIKQEGPPGYREGKLGLP